MQLNITVLQVSPNVDVVTYLQGTQVISEEHEERHSSQSDEKPSESPGISSLGSLHAGGNSFGAITAYCVLFSALRPA
jgi:hypothetical protein